MLFLTSGEGRLVTGLLGSAPAHRLFYESLLGKMAVAAKFGLVLS